MKPPLALLVAALAPSADAFSATAPGAALSRSSTAAVGEAVAIAEEVDGEVHLVAEDQPSPEADGEEGEIASGVESEAPPTVRSVEEDAEGEMAAADSDAGGDAPGPDDAEEGKMDVEEVESEPMPGQDGASCDETREEVDIAEEGKTESEDPRLEKGDADANDAPNGVERQTTMASLEDVVGIATAGALSSAILSVIYALVVHSFLSAPHERSFCDGRHWRPILIRAAFAAVTWGLTLATLVCVDSSVAVMAVEVVLSLIATISSVKLMIQTRKKEVDGPPPPSVCMKDKVVLVTGANSGIGLETARQLYEMGATVVLGCRSRKRAEAAKKDIVGRSHTDEGSSDRVIILEMDLSSLGSVRKAVGSFLERDLPLHVHINNAGVMRNNREETEDGLELTMAANHLGHFLLTSLLLPKLRETAAKERQSTRVVNVSSSLYHTAQRYNTDAGKMEPGLDLDDLLCQRKTYSLFGQYAQSKLANILFSRELGRRERERCNNLREAKSVATVATPLMKRKKKMRPKLTPVSDVVDAGESFDDGVGLGFDDIVTASPSPGREKKKKGRIRPVPTDHIDENEGDDEGGAEISGRRQKLAPASPREVADEDEEEDESCLAPSDATCPVLSFCLHPGLVRTNVVRDMPFYLFWPNKACSFVMALLQKSPRAGAFTSAFCAVADTKEMALNTDCYYVNSGPQPLDSSAVNDDDAKRLWEQSEALTQRKNC
ncbi:hypothetical protein ACHAXT_012846 [Thalassiosira profunda]